MKLARKQTANWVYFFCVSDADPDWLDCPDCPDRESEPEPEEPDWLLLEPDPDPPDWAPELLSLLLRLRCWSPLWVLLSLFVDPL